MRTLLKPFTKRERSWKLFTNITKTTHLINCRNPRWNRNSRLVAAELHPTQRDPMHLMCHGNTSTASVLFFQSLRTSWRNRTCSSARNASMKKQQQFSHTMKPLICMQLQKQLGKFVKTQLPQLVCCFFMDAAIGQKWSCEKGKIWLNWPDLSKEHLQKWSSGCDGTLCPIWFALLCLHLLMLK